jgi:hypothetical protein
MFMGNSLSWKDVNAINERIDNPTFQDKILSQAMGNRFNVPHLNYWGHRKTNHDFLSMFNVGYQKAGYKGVQAAALHYMEDIISDELRNNLGTAGRDLFEAAMNYSFSKHRRHTALRRM